MSITVEYDGEWPSLCSGTLVLVVDGARWQFPRSCLSSGGSCGFDDNWNEYTTEGPWGIDTWPDGFPEKLKARALAAVNEEIPWGCCGGCI